FTGHDGPTINVIPNPFNMQVAIEVDSSVSGELMIDVYSVTGRKIRSLFDGSISPGSRVFTWNGRDNDGKRLPSGVYMCRVESGGEVSTVRMVLVR
ncbi:MAG: T9SS type A sorting domain-containing protein, partial [Candidatus Thermoplasmatota archaeon]|nr:T9SS type A sorting domain-containing protein [Candidatus Thermoplasmatota archaeon]